MRGYSEIGRVWMKDSREPVCRRSAPFALCPASAKLVRTPLSRPNSRNAARIDSRVRIVRVLRRNSSDQMRGRYFIAASWAPFPVKAGEGGGGMPFGKRGPWACPPGVPLFSQGEEFRSCVRGLLHQRALVQVQRVARVLGGLRVVGDHDDGLAMLAVEYLQQAQDLLGGLTIEVAGGLVADQQ